MNRKIIAILAILVMAVSVSAVSAFGFDDLVGGDSSDEPKTVEIDGFEFALPDDFKENSSYEAINEKSETGNVEYTYCQKLFENSKGDSVSILVGDYGDLKVTDSIISTLGGEKTTIKGIDGYMSEESGISIFSYPKDDKLVVITADNEDQIEGFIIAE